MELISDTKSLKFVHQEKSKELHAKLERTDSKNRINAELWVKDGEFISNLGWIGTMSVTIAGITMFSFGAGI